MLIPSIDLMGGRAVQLRRGRDPVLTDLRDPVALAAEFNRYGEVAVIDLDAALGTGDNLDLIRRICRVAEVRAGGGIRDYARADELLRAGATKLIIGTAAEAELLKRLPAEAVIVALDQVDGGVVDQGWRRATGESVLVRAQRLAPWCGGFLCTFVAGEGGLGGMDPEAVTTLRESLPRPLTVAGGIRDDADAIRILRLGVDVQIGMALYTDRLDPAAVVTGTAAFDRAPLLPTIVQDEAGQVLMLAWSSPESLRRALGEGKGIYYSRSRREIWEKGATSGNRQLLLSCRADCDGDAMLFRVRQTGGACHSGSYSCFGRQGFSLTRLHGILEQRREELPPGSYAARLFTEPGLLHAKILEEAAEVVSAGDRRNLVWELADLTFFLVAEAARAGIGWQEVIDELKGRHR